MEYMPRLYYITPNEWQQRDIDAIMFGGNYMLVAEDEEGRAFLDFNITNDLFVEGLKSVCEKDQHMLDMLTDLIIDLHNQKK